MLYGPIVCAEFTQRFPIPRKLFDSYGPLLFYGSIASYVVYIGFQLGGNFWLTVWTSDPQANTDPGVRDMYLGIYGLLGIFQVNSLHSIRGRIRLAPSLLSITSLSTSNGRRILRTELRKVPNAWLLEVCSSSSLTVLPGSACVVLIYVLHPFVSAL